MPADYGYVAIFLIIGVAFAVATLIASAILQRLLKVYKANPEKLSTYECGEQPIGQAWSQFNVRYYLFALIFVIFDVETIFLYPWAVRFKSLGFFGYGEMLVFIAILFVGLLYAWRKGVLKWI
jgi:NADH-quinone oxidoreductase subunit A